MIPAAGDVQVITLLPEPPITFTRNDAARPTVVLKTLLGDPAIVGAGFTITVKM